MHVSRKFLTGITSCTNGKKYSRILEYKKKTRLLHYVLSEVHTRQHYFDFDYFMNSIGRIGYRKSK